MLTLAGLKRHQQPRYELTMNEQGIKGRNDRCGSSSTDVGPRPKMLSLLKCWVRVSCIAVYFIGYNKSGLPMQGDSDYCHAGMNRGLETTGPPLPKQSFIITKGFIFGSLNGPSKKRILSPPRKRSSRHNCNIKAFTTTLHEENTFLLYSGILTTGIRPNDKKSIVTIQYLRRNGRRRPLYSIMQRKIPVRIEFAQ